MPTRCLFLLACALILAAPATADFAPITDAERALTEVPDDPGAPAVVLFKKARLKMMDYPREVSSMFEVEARIKILTEEGMAYGEVEIPHSGFYRLKKIKGRTVLPDGRIVELPEDAVFEERRSKSSKLFVTKAVFPAVEVGAILDYRYVVRWDSFIALEPWYFHDELPTMLSEITYVKPDNLGVVPWGIQTSSEKLQTESRGTPKAVEVRVWVEDMVGFPSEPYSFPFADLSTRFMMIPKEIATGTARVPLLDSWKGACGFYLDGYKDFRGKSRAARKQALTLTAKQPSTREKIAAVYAFVRDEIRTIEGIGLAPREGARADKVLADRTGEPIEQALLLQEMLDAIKVDAEIVWVADRTTGRAVLEVPNPWWFDTAIVRVLIDGEPIFLDPSDRGLGFGAIPPIYEGTKAIVVGKKPEEIELPTSPAERNLRRAQVDLALDDEGRVSGGGTLILEGHQAWQNLGEKDAEGAREAWQEWLEESYPGFEVDEVQVEEDRRAQRVRVGWSLVQREEEVLGDETSLVLTRPIGPLSQPFALPPERRRTPVQLPYARRDEVTTTVSWPEGWALDVAPQDVNFAGPAGTVRVRFEPDGNRLSFSRRFERTRSDFSIDDYAVVRDLYEQLAKADAQDLVLVRR